MARVSWDPENPDRKLPKACGPLENGERIARKRQKRLTVQSNHHPDGITHTPEDPITPELSPK